MNCPIKMSDARNTAKSTDADLKLLNEKIHYLGQYLSTKAAYKAFLQAGNKKMYRSAHQDEIARYEEAIQFLKRNSTDGTIPTEKNLRAEKESCFLLKPHNTKATPISKITTTNCKPLAGMLILFLKWNTRSSTAVPSPSAVTNHHSNRWHEKASHKTSL